MPYCGCGTLVAKSARKKLDLKADCERRARTMEHSNVRKHVSPPDDVSRESDPRCGPRRGIRGVSVVRGALSVTLLFVALLLLTTTEKVVLAPSASAQSGFKNPRVVSMRMIHPNGSRPKWSPTGDRFVFEVRHGDGFYDLYVSDRQGRIQSSLTRGRPINQKHNGNAIYRPIGSGTYIAFLSEEPTHYPDWTSYGPEPASGPGVGVYNNLWVTDGQGFWKLTNIPIKQSATDETPAMATVNPRFSWFDSTLVWTERYAPGGNNDWGKWRLKAGNFVVGQNGPELRNQRVIFTPSVGTYVTAMEFMMPNVLLVAGNLDGQHEYDMDQYLLHIPSGTRRNLTSSPDAWEEGACVAPSGKIVYMTNRDSHYPLDRNRDWVGQPVERDYWLMDADGSNKERLTYLNDPSAPEYKGWRAVTIVCDVSPDGKTVAATIGRDFGDETTADILWQVWLIELSQPL
jgi:hypothetical protein